MMGLMALIERSKVEVLLNASLLEVTRHGASFESGGSRRELKVDSVVTAQGFRPQLALRDALQGKVPELFAVGDCVEPRDILHAMWEAYHASRLI